MCVSEPLEGSYADSRELMDLQVGEALEGHGESHLFELVRDMAANHGPRTGKGKRKRQH